MNIKLKYYLRGLGAGIIISTIILSIAFSIKDNKKPETTEKTTNKPIYNSSTESAKTEPVTEKAKEPVAEKSTELVTEVSTEAPTEAPTQAPTEQVTEEEKPAEPVTDVYIEPTTVQSDGTNVTLYIPHELNNSYAIAAFLMENGIIADANDFNYYMENNGYDKRLQTGEKTFAVGASYEEIAETLCR